MNIFRKVIRFLRRLNYAHVTEFKNGYAFAMPGSTIYYGFPTVVKINEDYKIVEWTNYKTFEEAEKNS